MKSFILALSVDTICLVFSSDGKEVQGDTLNHVFPSKGKKEKVMKDKSASGNDNTMYLTLNQKENLQGDEVDNNWIGGRNLT